jgi:hypothetical protein
MREGTTSRVMAADRPYGEFYDFYSVSPGYFKYTLVFYPTLQTAMIPTQIYVRLTFYIVMPYDYPVIRDFIILANIQNT